MITVFYDGKCGLCRREISYYQRIAPEGVFDWIDITQTPEPFNSLGFATTDGLRLLHVRDAAGRMHIGVAGFIALWRGLPRWRYLAMFVALPVIYQLAEWLYRKFAAWRFKRLGYATCEF